MEEMLITKQLENVAINDVLPLKAARRDAIANEKRFWAPGYLRPNVDGFIYIHYAAPPYSACISAIYLLSFGKVWFALCNAWQQSRTENNFWLPIFGRDNPDFSTAGC